MNNQLKLLGVLVLLGGCGIPSVDSIGLTYNNTKMQDQDALMERAWKLYGRDGTPATGAPIYWLETGNCGNGFGFQRPGKADECLDGLTHVTKVTSWDIRVDWIAVEEWRGWYGLSHELLHAAISQGRDWAGDPNHEGDEWKTLWPEAWSWAK